MTAAVGIKRLLAADQDVALRKLFEEALPQEGFLVRTCGNAADFNAEVAAFKPAVIIVDSNLPPKGGWVLVSALRKRGYVAPIILLTGCPAIAGNKTFKEMPGVHYLEKPFSLQELFQTLART